MKKTDNFFYGLFLLIWILIQAVTPCHAAKKNMPEKIGGAKLRGIELSAQINVFQAEGNENSGNSGSEEDGGSEDQQEENGGNGNEENGNGSSETSGGSAGEKEENGNNSNYEDSSPQENSGNAENSESVQNSGEAETSQEKTEDSSGNGKDSSAARPGEGSKILRSEVIHKFEGGVTEIQTGKSSNFFFAAGTDGFITRYSFPALVPDSWQISRLPIKKIAVHPNGKYIAVYESDGFSTHRVSLWEWESKKKLFAKRLGGSVTSLSWSESGSYLFVGNRSLEGITVFNQAGIPQNIYSSAPGIVFLAATGGREKTIVTYGESGRLVYTDIAQKKKLAEYKTENKLENTNLIKNFTQIIGYKNNTVFVINASTGKTIKEYHAENAIFASKTSDTEPIWLERINRKNEWIVRKGNASSSVFTLPRAFEITSAKYLNSSIVLGGKNGEIHILKIEKENIELTMPLVYNTVPVVNITSNDENFFFIAKNKIYLCTAPDMPVSILAEDIDSNCFTYHDNGFVLWSDEKASPVYYLPLSTGKKKIIFKPKEPIISLSIYEKNISAVESFGDVSIIEIESGKKIFSYNAAGIQSAVQLDSERLLISKSSVGKTQSPIFELNIFTKETTPLQLEGDLVLSLTADTSSNRAFFCFLLKSAPSGRTSLIRFKTGNGGVLEGKFENLLTYGDEDLEAFIANCKNGVITNFGKENLIFFNTKAKQGFKLQRDSALSKKAASSGGFILSLNFDGSLSWYDAKKMEFIKNIRYGNKS